MALSKDDAYLFYDQAYFELSHLLSTRENHSIARWISILDSISSITLSKKNETSLNVKESDDIGLVRFVKAIRGEVYSWINKHEENRKSSLEGQYTLARIAVGLNFVNKNIPFNLRLFSLLYAANNLKYYLKLFELEWPKSGPTLKADVVANQPDTDQWRIVWKECDQFNKQKGKYILIVGPETKKIDKMSSAILGRLPWSLIFDLDPKSADEGIFASIGPVLSKHRGVHLTTPSDKIQVNYGHAANYVMACGLSRRVDTVTKDFNVWRRNHLKNIRKILEEMKNTVAPENITLLVLPFGIEQNFIERLWETIDEVYGDDLRTVFIKEESSVNKYPLEGSQIENVICSIDELLSGFYYILGDAGSNEQVLLPTRPQGEEDNSSKRIFKVIDNERVRRIEEDLLVVHAGLTISESDKLPNQSFLRGNKISWSEVDIHDDVPRDIMHKLKTRINQRLDDYRNSLISLEHMPGSGGTTIARRLAWDFKDLFPTVLLRKISENTVARIEELFHFTNIPILTIIDTININSKQIEQLIRSLNARKTRAVMIYFYRSISPSSEFRLEDPLGEKESKRFLNRYLQNAMPNRHKQLNDLSNNDELQQYRSPFFFGLYAFEKEFTHIPSWVKAHLQNLSSKSELILKYLALIGRYSQHSISEIQLKKLFDLSSRSILRISDLFGDSTERLILISNNGYRIIHPLIAEEILSQLLSNSCNGDEINWKERLADLCCSFIKDMSVVSGNDSELLKKVLIQLFIIRDTYQPSFEVKRNFSELILSIPNNSGQYKVLKTLVDFFPDEAHFWTHLGRHNNYIMKSVYTDAENFLLKAISLEPYDDYHEHSLGMVYRFELKRRMTIMIRKGEDLTKPYENIYSLFQKASECFARARELDPESEYNYITNIQLISETIESFYRSSEAENYATFFTRDDKISRWCRDELNKASELLYSVKLLQPSGNLSQKTIECESKIEKFFGRIESLISGLQNLLDKNSQGKASIRRIIAETYIQNSKHNWSKLSSKRIRRIYLLMNQNLEEKLNNYYDALLWFNAYRRLPDFDFIEALDSLSNLAARKDNVFAHYYLYILHFIRWQQGVLIDNSSIKKHLEKCKYYAGEMYRTRAREWLATAPKWLPLVSENELGKWKDRDDIKPGLRFYSKTERLRYVNGTIIQIKSPQSGIIAISPQLFDGDKSTNDAGMLEVFFWPLTDFFKGQDENVNVKFFLGFSYEGLRGWNVQRI